jgi:hypothetical protein
MQYGRRVDEYVDATPQIAQRDAERSGVFYSLSKQSNQNNTFSYIMAFRKLNWVNISFQWLLLLSRSCFCINSKYAPFADINCWWFPFSRIRPFSINTIRSEFWIDDRRCAIVMQVRPTRARSNASCTAYRWINIMHWIDQFNNWPVHFLNLTPTSLRRVARFSDFESMP